MPNNYGTLTVLDSSPSGGFTEPLTIAEVKTFLNLPEQSDQLQDAELEMFIAAAREQAELLQRRDLVRKRWQLSLDGFFAAEIELRPLLVSVDLVTYKDSGGTIAPLTEGAGFIVDTAKQPGLIMPPYGGSWPSFTPWPTSAVTIQFTAGCASDAFFWHDAGARVKIGMQQLISHWFNGKLPFELGASAIQEYPFTVTALLSAGAVPRGR